jgi:hypothetical protein
MLADQGEDVIDIIARIDDHGFVSFLVADDRAVALQRADGEDLVDHGDIVASEFVVARSWFMITAKIPTSHAKNA